MALVAPLLVVAAPLGGTAAGDARGGDPSCFGEPATITGTPGADRINGTAGDDIIVSGGGFDVVHGLGGDDKVCTGRGGDHLFGESGNDRLSGGRDGRRPDDDVVTSDVLDGGRGNDRINGGPGLSANRPGVGDLAVYRDAPAAVQLSLTSDIAESGQYTDRLVSIEDATGTAQADVLTGDVRPNDLEGLAGQDELFGGDAFDRLGGGAGNDLAVSGDQYDIVFGDSGDDVLRSGRGPDEVYGEEGQDRLYGEEGDDRLYGEDGRDMADGGRHNRFDYCRAEVIVDCER